MPVRATALIAGTCAVLVAVIVLWRMTRVPSGTAATRAPTAPAGHQPTSTPRPAVEGSTRPTATPATARPIAKVQLQAPAGDAAPPPPSTAGDGGKKLVPIASLPVLRQAVAALDSAMTDCVERYGQGVSGTANLSFVVAPNNGQVDIENTGVIDEGTTITNTELLDCMHRTALALRFPYAADAKAVLARRVARVDDGKLVTQHIVNFSYLK